MAGGKTRHLGDAVQVEQLRRISVALPAFQHANWRTLFASHSKDSKACVLRQQRFLQEVGSDGEEEARSCLRGKGKVNKALDVKD